jgi:hypothetical protein
MIDHILLLSLYKYFLKIIIQTFLDDLKVYLIIIKI